MKIYTQCLKYEFSMKWHCGVCLYIYKWLGFASPIQAHATTDWTNKKRGKTTTKPIEENLPKTRRKQSRRKGRWRWTACQSPFFLSAFLFFFNSCFVLVAYFISVWFHFFAGFFKTVFIPHLETGYSLFAYILTEWCCISVANKILR